MPRIYCLDCSMETEHMSISQAARTAQVTRTTIYNWLRRWQLHTVQRPSGRILICTRSLVIYDGRDRRLRVEDPGPRLEGFRLRAGEVAMAGGNGKT